MPEVTTVRAAANILGVHENTIRNWIALGELPSEQRGAFRLPLWEAVEQRSKSSRFAAPEKMIEALEEQAATLEAEAQRLRAAADLLRAE